MKYIIVKEMGIEVAIVFSELIGHDSFLNMYSSDEILSAGFCYPTDESLDVGFNTYRQWIAYGQSKSLGKSFRSQDSYVITVSLGMTC